ncbi:hypothetical protein C2759_02630 [Polynucleobacter sp. MG-Unter2-18]|uniref:hypothetical protein n=1 Tax=Polynucleobacter sp. MG-Unter2-18 TaxID=2081052 RepID=UPI001BFD4DEB|nr:hypothetical protein [Polynucleobacter sp. MG-Unter2-18]QWD95052.1 hypothetical protein C2759_02630 [Polynucleobacter sp. MG-Unter2-18]
MNDVELSKLRRKDDYYQNGAPDWVRIIWGRKESFEWFLKNNRRELVQSHAIIRLGRDYFVHSGRFDVVAKKIIGCEKTL